MKNNIPIHISNVNPSGRGMNGAVYDASGVSPTLTTNKGEGLKVRVSAPPCRLMVLSYMTTIIGGSSQIRLV